MKKIKVFFFLTFILIVLTPLISIKTGYPEYSSLYAQVKDQCGEQLDKAEEEYQAGRWTESIELIDECLKKKNVSEIERGRAYRILGLVYIAIQLEKEANEAVKNLLIMVPNYKVDPDRDPPSLQRIIDSAAQTLNPKIISISPSSIEKEEKGFTITVTGSSFVYGSVVKFNEAAKATTYISSTELKAEIPSSDIVKEGEFAVTVYSPIMGGKTSNSELFIVKKSSGFPWTWIAVGGGAIVAAVVAILALGGGEDDDDIITPTTIADPPGRP
jgi:tetratricopeptide (TPR) repeat protein